MKKFLEENKTITKRILLIIGFGINILMLAFGYIDQTISLILLITIYSLLDQLFIPAYPLPSVRIFTYIVLIIFLTSMLLLHLDNQSICKQLSECKKYFSEQNKTCNITNLGETNGTK